MHSAGYRIAQLGGVLIVVGGLFDISLREPLPHHEAILAAGSGAAGQEPAALVLALLRALGAALVATGLAILVILWFSRRTRSVFGYAAAATVALLAEGLNAWGIFKTGSAMYLAPLIFMATVVTGAALCIRSLAAKQEAARAAFDRTAA